MAQETSDMNEPVLHPAPAEGFGAALKRAREAQGISIGDMAARSRLSVQQVRALESERTAELPEPVYVRAFIRGVASVLGLEPDPLVADYTARYGAASVGVLPAHDPAKEGTVCTVSLVCSGEGTIKDEFYFFQGRRDHLLGKESNTRSPCGMRTGRTDHIRPHNIKNADKRHFK